MSNQTSWLKRCDVTYCVNEFNNNVTFFPAPKDPSLFKLWSQAVHCTGTVLTQNGKICEKHFSPKDIMEFKCLKKGKEGSKSSDVTENVKLRVPIHGAIPSRFEDEIAEYLKQKELKDKQSTSNPPVITSKFEDNLTPGKSIFRSVEIVKPKPPVIIFKSAENPLPDKQILQCVEPNKPNSPVIVSKPKENTIPKRQIVRCAETIKSNIIRNEKVVETSVKIIKNLPKSVEEIFFEKLYNGQIEPRLPNKSWNLHNCDYPERGVVFAELAELSTDIRIPPFLKKSVFFDECFNMRIYFFGKLFPNVEYDGPKCIGDLEELLRQIDSLKICEGGPRLTELTNSRFAFRDEGIYKWRHNNCELRLEKGRICKNCILLCKTVGQRNSDLFTKIGPEPISLFPTAKRIKIDQKVVNRPFK